MNDYFNNQGGEGRAERGNTPPADPYQNQYGCGQGESLHVGQNQSQYGGWNQPGHGTESQYRQEGSGGQPPQKPKKKRKLGLIVTATALAGVMAGSLVTGFVVAPMAVNAALARQQGTQAARGEKQPPDITAEKAAETPAMGGGTPAIADTANPVPEVVAAAKQSVVQVVEYQSSTAPGSQIPDEQQIASGSGFVISEDGYIMTNNHVVADGNSFKIVANDGTEYPAELVGRDASSEVAVLKVEGLDLPALSIGNSDEAVTGEMVIAIGNPLGSNLQNTVTVGYLSAVSREVTMSGNSMTMLQTDAAINPGNSGGPLLNTKGEVIGINTMKSISAGYDSYGNNISAEGIGFAIPITDAMRVAEVLIRDGSIPRPGIGVSYAMLDEATAAANGLPQGAYVQQVAQGSPAALAGIKPGDVITRLDGVDMSRPDAAVDLSGKAVGDKVSAVVWRNGQSYDVKLEVADLNQAEQQNQMDRNQDAGGRNGGMPDISGLIPDFPF